MVTFDQLRDGIEAVKRVVSHLEVERREERAVGGDDTVRREQTQGLYVGRRINKIIHAFIEAGMGGLS
jgi:hypothetical protein